MPSAKAATAKQRRGPTPGASTSMASSRSRSTPDLSRAGKAAQGRPLLIDAPPQIKARRMTYGHQYYGSRPPWAVDEDEETEAGAGTGDSTEDKEAPPFYAAGGSLPRDDAAARKRRIQAARQLYRTPASRRECAGSVDDLLKSLEERQPSREQSGSMPDGLGLSPPAPPPPSPRHPAAPRFTYRTTRASQTPADTCDAGVGTGAEPAPIVLVQEVADEAGTEEAAALAPATARRARTQPRASRPARRPPAAQSPQTSQSSRGPRAPQASQGPHSPRSRSSASPLASPRPLEASQGPQSPRSRSSTSSLASPRPAQASQGPQSPRSRSAASPAASPRPSASAKAPRSARPVEAPLARQASRPAHAHAPAPVRTTVASQTDVTGEDFRRAMAAWSDDSLDGSGHASDILEPVLMPRPGRVPRPPSADANSVREALERLESACRALSSTTARSSSEPEPGDDSVATDPVLPVRQARRSEQEPALVDSLASSPPADRPDGRFLGLAERRARSPVFGSLPALAADVDADSSGPPGLAEEHLDALERARRSRSLDDVDLDKIFGAVGGERRAVPAGRDPMEEVDRRINYWLHKSIYYERDPRLGLGASPAPAPAPARLETSDDEVDVSFEDSDEEEEEAAPEESFDEDTLDEEALEEEEEEAPSPRGGTVMFISARPIREERRRQRRQKSVDFEEAGAQPPTPTPTSPPPETRSEARPEAPAPERTEVSIPKAELAPVFAEAPPVAPPRTPRNAWPTPPIQRVSDDQLPPEIQPRSVAEKARMFAQFAASAETRLRPPCETLIAGRRAPTAFARTAPSPAAQPANAPTPRAPRRPPTPPPPRDRNGDGSAPERGPAATPAELDGVGSLRRVNVVRNSKDADDFRRRPKTKSIFLTAPGAPSVNGSAPPRQVVVVLDRNGVW